MMLPTHQRILDAYHRLRNDLGREPSNQAIAEAIGSFPNTVRMQRIAMDGLGILPYRPDLVRCCCTKNEPRAPRETLTPLEQRIIKGHQELVAMGGPIWRKRLSLYVGCEATSLAHAWRRLIKRGLLPPWDACPGSVFGGGSRANVPKMAASGNEGPDAETLETIRAEKAERGELTTITHNNHRRAASDPRPKWRPDLPPRLACEAMRHEDRQTIRRRRKLLARGGQRCVAALSAGV
jgi:hypothetical protein